MPCAAAVNFRLKQDTPGPPRFTWHKCRSCQGYLYALCIDYVPDPIGKKIMNKYIAKLTRAIARWPGNGAHHDCTLLHLYCCALCLFHGCVRMPSGSHGYLSLLYYRCVFPVGGDRRQGTFTSNEECTIIGRSNRVHSSRA